MRLRKFKIVGLIGLGIVVPIQNLIASNTSVIGDRLIVAINNIPYSQSQIERFVDVKESLRDDAIKSRCVDQSSWTQAVESFVIDMMIHQEASKSSGFRPTKEMIDKLFRRSTTNRDSAPQFMAAFKHLGLDRTAIETELLKIATIENYRRGKKALNSDGATNANSNANQWERELTSKSIVRYFDQAKIWISLYAAHTL